MFFLGIYSFRLLETRIFKFLPFFDIRDKSKEGYFGTAVEHKVWAYWMTQTRMGAVEGKEAVGDKTNQPLKNETGGCFVLMGGAEM